MEAVLLIGVIVVLVTGLLLVGVFMGLRGIARNREQAAQIRFPNAKIIAPGALFYGQESLGVTQMRGNGTLVLTDEELYFERWLPQREYRIPLSAIQSVEMPSSFLGKTNFQHLLKVNFINADGHADAMAWLLKDLGGFKRTLEERLAQR